MRLNRSRLAKTICIAVGAMSIGAAVWAADAPAPAPKQAPPPGWGAGPQQGEQRDGGGMREIAQSRTELIRVVLGTVQLEKNTKLALTAAQAKSLKPVVAAIKKTGISASNGTRFGGFGSDGQRPDQATIDKSRKEMEAQSKVYAGYLAKFEKILNAKQLGAIDQMEFEGVGGWGRGQNQGQNSTSGQSQSGQGQQGGRASWGGGQGGMQQGQMPSQQEIEKMMKEMEARQKKLDATITKAITDLQKIIDKKAK